jgi:hypothetical protein
MSDTTTTDTGDADDSNDTGQSTDTGDTGKDWAAEAAKWRELARKHEERSKANATAAKELEQLRHQSMSDQEKAVAEAKAAGLAEGLVAGAVKVAAAEVRAAAAGRLTDEQVDALIGRTNLGSFIGDDGEVNRADVLRFMDDIAPKTTDDQETRQGFPDLGQGARGGNNNAALNGDPLLRDLKAKLGIR